MTKRKREKPDVVIHICNPKTWEAEAGGLITES